jgi:hypothetical protein
MTNREIDVQIAEKLFGAKVEFLNQRYGWRVDYVADNNECNDPNLAMDMVDGWKLKHYSRDIKSAFQVVEKLRTAGYTVDLSSYPEEREWLQSPYDNAPAKEWVLKRGPDYYQCRLSKYEKFCGWICVCDPIGSSPAEVICMAALEALESQNG